MDLSLPKNEFRISIISSCNMKCIYCHNEGNKHTNMLTIDEIKKIMDNSYDLGMTSVRLTGGEPLIHPQIFEICKMLSEEYKLKVGINTNCIEYEKLLYMIDNGWIDRVIVGLDDYDNKISKNSPIGKSSKEILNNILSIKNKGCNVSISNVYNGDYDNIYKLVNWCQNNHIRIKIIELIENKIFENSDADYIKMRNRLINDFNFAVKIDEFEEYNCYKNQERIVSFFPSLCRLRRCDLCKRIHLRITSTGYIKQCIHYSDNDKYLLGNNCRQNIIKELESEVNYHREN